jgi:hypothetical protein
MAIYDLTTGAWHDLSMDKATLQEQLGISSTDYNSGTNHRCARGSGTVNYWLFGYGSWWDKDNNFEFKPIRRAGCASQGYHAYGMTYYSPSGCKCYTMVNSAAAGLGPGSNARAGGGGRGFIALGQSGSTKIIRDDWRLLPASVRREGVPDDVYSTAVLRKQAGGMGPIVADWPENRPEAAGLGKRAGWQTYDVGGYRFSSMGSMLQVQVAKDGEVVDRVVMGGRLATAPVVHDGRAYFGSKDGYVYAYELAEKKPSWRFLAAPHDERIMFASQLESHWPVTRLAIENGRLRVTAGRHEEIGGYYLYGLNPYSGEILSSDVVGGKKWEYVAHEEAAAPGHGASRPGYRDTPGATGPTRFIGTKRYTASITMLSLGSGATADQFSDALSVKIYDMNGRVVRSFKGGALDPNWRSHAEAFLAKGYYVAKIVSDRPINYMP